MRIDNLQFRWVRLVALTAALTAVFFVASGATQWHSDARGSEAACPICHVAHMPALQSAPASISARLTPVEWVVATETLSGHMESFHLLPPARAPPVPAAAFARLAYSIAV